MRITIHKKHVAGERRNWFEYLLETMRFYALMPRFAMRKDRLRSKYTRHFLHRVVVDTSSLHPIHYVDLPVPMILSLVHGVDGGGGQFLGWMSFEDTWFSHGWKKKKKSSVASGKNRQVWSVDGKNDDRRVIVLAEVSTLGNIAPHRLIVAIYKLIGGGKGNWFAKRTRNKSILIGATNTVYRSKRNVSTESDFSTCDCISIFSPQFTRNRFLSIRQSSVSFRRSILFRDTDFENNPRLN